MIVLKGKYNYAKVMIDQIDSNTRAQIEGFLNCPVFKAGNIAIMPDCHAGAGAVIGFTMLSGDYVVPNIIGVDIGCGVLTINLGKRELDLKSIDEKIKQFVPVGFNIHPGSPNLNRLASDVGLATKKGEVACSVCCVGDMIGATSTEEDRYIRSLGTLGGGNHFIEIGKDEEENIWLTIHSGSRKFGLDVAKFYQKEAAEFTNNVYFGEWEHKGLEFLLRNSHYGRGYLEAHYAAVSYADFNREFMSHIILKKVFDIDVDEILELEKVSSVHNCIGPDGVIRKGAIRIYDEGAECGLDVVIPFNMKEGIIVGTGKKVRGWNNSGPHGAGRVMSRKEAKNKLDVDTVNASLSDAGVYTTSINRNSVDEAPEAYKSKEVIMEAIKDIIEVKHVIRPIYVRKG